MRAWVYQTLVISNFVTNLHGGLFETSRTTKVPHKKPYSYYRMGLSDRRVHSSVPVRSTPLQVFVYDEPGDFGLIEQKLEEARVALTTYPPLVSEPRLVSCVWDSMSADLSEDPLTGTIAKFARLTIIHT